MLSPAALVDEDEEAAHRRSPSRQQVRGRPSMYIRTITWAEARAARPAGDEVAQVEDTGPTRLWPAAAAR